MKTLAIIFSFIGLADNCYNPDLISSPTGTCWKRNTTPLNWNDASDACNAWGGGGALLKINSQTDFDAFKNFSNDLFTWTGYKTTVNDQLVTSYRWYSTKNSAGSPLTWAPNYSGCCDMTSAPGCLRVPNGTRAFYDEVCNAATNSNNNVIQSICEKPSQSNCSNHPIANAVVDVCCDGSAQVTCNTGFYQNGLTYITCTGGTWSSTVTCTAQCPTFSVTYGSVTYSDPQRKTGSTATITCSGTAVLVGGNRLSCSTHTWTPLAPQCKNYCPPVVLPNGLTSYVPSGAPYDNGTQATVTCNNGYSPTGSGTIICQDTGLWNPTAPTCTPNCHLLTSPDNGSVVLSDSNCPYGSVASFSCHQKFTLIGDPVLTCLQNASWSNPVPQCKPYCYSNPCQHGGTCVDENTGFSCICPYGYSGVDCSIINYCIVSNQTSQNYSAADLQKNLTIVPKENMMSNVQSMGYLTSDTTKNLCSPNGFCVSDNSTAFCICFPHYYGAQCQNKNCSTYDWSSWSNQCTGSCTSGGYLKRTRLNAPDCEIDKKPCVCPSDPLSPVTRTAVNVALSLGCVTLLVFVSSSLGIFLVFRLLQMCQEIALIIAHTIVTTQMFHQRDKPTCTAIAIALQYFFTVNFTFLALEALQTLCILRNVISEGGFFTAKVNLAIGWGVPLVIVLGTAPFLYQEYITEYTCWLNLGSKAAFSTVGPIMVASLLTIIMTEAATMGKSLKRLPLTSAEKLIAAQVSQKGASVILLFNVLSWFFGVVAIWKQDVPSFAIVAGLNATVGVLIFLVHIIANERVLQYLKEKFCRKKKLAVGT